MPGDGLKPETFYTYHIVFVPDMTQKFALKIKGGVGEFRAAMNLVNGWQFTGLGPYYMKDSSTAQNTLAGGITANLAASGVADVVKAVANIKPPGAAGITPQSSPGSGTPAAQPVAVDAARVQAVHNLLRSLNPKTLTLNGFAEISIYEPYIAPEGTMEWRLITKQSFSRDYLSVSASFDQVMAMLKTSTTTPAVAPTATNATGGGAAQGPSGQVQAPAGNAQAGGPAGGPSPGGAAAGAPAADSAAAAAPPALPNEEGPPIPLVVPGQGSGSATQGNAGAAEPEPSVPADPTKQPHTPVTKPGPPPAPSTSPGPSARTRGRIPPPLTPITRGNGATPPLQGPKVSSTTKSTVPRPLEMASAGPRADNALVRSEMKAPGFLDAHLAANALAQLDNPGATFLALRRPLPRETRLSSFRRMPNP